ncbi:uncharacterized protein LOC144129633 [Amblyomma americanum]
MALRDVLVSDSQLKRMCRSRLRLRPSVETCTFSFSGYDAVRLASAVRRINLLRTDFCVVYVRGNDIFRPNTSPQEICNIKAFVLQLLRDVTFVVLVVKVLPRWFITADAEVSRSWLNRRHLLNRKLSATLKRMPSVFILNPDVSTDMLHRFLDASKLPKRHLFGADGYHLSGEGVKELAEILVRSLEKVYGPGILAPFSRVPTRHIINACHHCGTKGHVNGDCYEYCRP